jgi:hypothetical protein
MAPRKSWIVALTLAILARFAGAATADEAAETHHHEEMGVVQSMSSPHMHGGGESHAHMEAHMKWTAPRPKTPEDGRRSTEIVKILRTSLEKYRDHRVAEQEGFEPFLPQFPQPMYHFTNYWQGFKAAFSFDPARPTSLLYKKTAEGYELIGAMYTAPKGTAEEKLHERVPLSVARWHAHVNLCFPPRGTDPKTADWTRFGFRGSIATKEECTHAGGRFWPQMFGWMVHVYPFEDTPEKIWAQ